MEGIKIVRNKNERARLVRERDNALRSRGITPSVETFETGPIDTEWYCDCGCTNYTEHSMRLGERGIW